VRRDRDPVPELGFAPEEAPDGWSRDDDDVEDPACEGSFLGRSSGQLQPPGVSYPEEYDMMK
jgi:hypothetical protein